MVWFRVDDRFHGSGPVKRIPRDLRAAAVGLWTLAGCWSSQFLKDGYVPGHMIEDFGGTVELAQALVDAGLWRVKKDGFVFVDWDKWQPTREHVESKRKADADRAAAYRARKAANKGESHETVTRDESVSHAPVRSPRPDPTRPDHNPPTEGSAATRGTRLPEDWKPGPLLLEWAATKAPSVDVEVESEKFANYWVAKAGAAARKVSWDRTWQNWMLEQHQRNVQRGWKPDGDPFAGMREFR
jgi:hypothetical protein